VTSTRTWLTTPAGETPVDDGPPEEYWVPGPRLPTEPRPPFRFRGVISLAVVLLVVIGLTFLLAPTILDVQDPTFGRSSDG